MALASGEPKCFTEYEVKKLVCYALCKANGADSGSYILDITVAKRDKSAEGKCVCGYNTNYAEFMAPIKILPQLRTNVSTGRLEDHPKSSSYQSGGYE